MHTITTASALIALSLIVFGAAGCESKRLVTATVAAASDPGAENHHLRVASPQPAKRIVPALPKAPKERLARLVRVPTAHVGRVVTLRVAPPHDHHVNADAPSWIALFEQIDGQPAKRLFAVRRDAILSGALVLPTLETGHTYRLQGTLFYCTDGRGVCLLQSHDQELIADARDSSALDIALRAP